MPEWSHRSPAELCQVEYIGPLLSLNELVGKPGFEPGTSSSQTKRATKLRHSPYQYMPRAERYPVDVTSSSVFELEARVTRDLNVCNRYGAYRAPALTDVNVVSNVHRAVKQRCHEEAALALDLLP